MAKAIGEHGEGTAATKRKRERQEKLVTKRAIAHAMKPSFRRTWH